MMDHSAALCQCSSRMPPASRRMLTPASSLAMGSSRAVTSRDQPPWYTRLFASENGNLKPGMLPESETGGTLESGFAVSSARLVGPGELIACARPLRTPGTLSMCAPFARLSSPADHGCGRKRDRSSRRRGGQWLPTERRTPIGSSFSRRLHRHSYDLRQMHRPPPRALHDLLPATEPARHDQGIRRRDADLRKQGMLAHFHGNIVMAALVPERSRHAATAGIERLGLESHGRKDLLRGLEPHQRLLMAMPV